MSPVCQLIWLQLLWWQSKAGGRGGLKVQKSWRLRVRWSPFFQAFKWEITVCPCLLAGIPLGETRSGKASPRPVASNQRHVSNTHSHSGVPRLCVIVRQVVSMYLGRSGVRCLKLKRRIMRTHTMCKHFVNPPTSASSVASGVLTCLCGEQERLPRNSLTWIHSTILTPFRSLISQQQKMQLSVSPWHLVCFFWLEFESR